MARLYLLLLTLFNCVLLLGQTNKAIEISIIGRYDKQADYVSNFGGRVYNDTNRLYGISYGVSGIYRQKITKSNFVYFGLGYYQLRIDRIRGPLPFNIPGTRTARSIDYNDGTDILYGTPKYHYNDLVITIGFEQTFKTKKNFSIDVGTEIIGYKTVSQKYNIGNGSRYYKTKNSNPLELGVNLNAGIIKEYKKFYLRPSFIIPVYQNLKGDIVFDEDPKMNISKWFNGLGLSLKIGKYL